MSGFNFSVGNNSFNSLNRSPRAATTIKGRTGFTILLLVGLVFIGIGAFMLRAADEAKDWPSTTGTATTVDSRSVTDSDGNRDIEYRTTYAYSVDGSNYITTSTSKSFVQSGAKIDIKYNPDNPSKTFISNGPVGLLWIFPGIGLLLILFAVIKLITFRKEVIVPVPQTSVNPVAAPGIASLQPIVPSQATSSSQPTAPATDTTQQQPPLPPSQAL